MGRLDLRDPYRDEDFESGIEVVHRQQSEDVSLAASLRERGRGAGRVDAPAPSAPRDSSLKKSARDSGGLHPAREYLSVQRQFAGEKSLEHRAHAGRTS